VCGRVGFGSPTPSPSSYQREQRPRDHLAHRQLPGACIKPYALNQAAWQFYGKCELAFAHRDWLFQLLRMLDVTMGLPRGDRTLSRQLGDGLDTFLELPQQLASTIEPLSLLSIAGARHLS
jgi:hypothetical protein